MGPNTTLSDDLPDRPNATIRSPAAALTVNRRSGRSPAPHRRPYALICRYVFAVTGETALSATNRSRRGQQFRSLRLSVRTPPFHGGESGSIPLGSATTDKFLSISN